MPIKVKASYEPTSPLTHKNYSLRLISQLLNYYIGNSKEFLADIKDAKGDSDAIAKVFLRIRSEIENE